jgi:protein TonB
MANTLMTPPELDPDYEISPYRQVKELHLGGEDLEAAEQGVFASLGESLRDVFFPRKLPPLVLESRPVAVVDRMAVKRDPTTVAIAIVLHVVVIGLVLFLVAKKVVSLSAPKQLTVVALDAPPPNVPPRMKLMGGGGGQKGPAPVSKGSPPKFSPQQIVPPKAPPILTPKLAVAPTIDVDPTLKMQTTLPNIGMANAPNVGISMGNGNGNGLGSGNGNGLGPGSGGNTGGGVRQVGGGVSAPTLVYKVEAEFSEEARKAKVSGNVVVGLIVDEKGNAIRVHVVRGLGMGLDEKAVEAVRQFRFKPAMENGKPVKVEVNVEVNFQIF